MGWKGTKKIKRKDALKLINSRLFDLTDSELEATLEAMGFGDDVNLPHYGCNFSITEQESEDENSEETF